MPITYCIVCNVTGEKYYGSTVQPLEVRMKRHKSKSNTCCSKQIIERGDYDIYQLSEYETELEAKMKEDWYIDNKECINQQRVCLTDEERKQYYKEYSKKYYEENKEQIIEKSKQKYQENKEQINEKRKEKVECEFCKSIGRKDDLKRHQRSKKCKQFQ